MKILIVGNDPHEIGGVANYTRTLALKFSELGHDVNYFYSGAYHQKYNWIIKPYVRINKKAFPFECAEIINSPNWPYNYSNPSIDISAPETERLFSSYVERVKPDVLHIHSRMGLPVSIIEIASRMGVKVFNSIHVYGFLCQHRVMIDKNGMLCSGPYDIKKCAECISLTNINYQKFVARVRNTSKRLTDFLILIKRKIKKYIHYKFSEDKINVLTLGYDIEKMMEELKTRLQYMINVMNEHIVLNICVSSDVKNTLIKYGINKEKLIVQHIGSVIAEKQIKEQRLLHTPLVIGNIGGVGYYKGTHILLDAVSMIKNKDFLVKIFGKYDFAYITKTMEGREQLPVELLGSYRPEDLPDILRQIDIMVLPSICNDTAPQTIFESYSSRIPIIASNIGGFPDFIKDGENGLLFKAGDSEDLAFKIDTILDNPDLITHFSSEIPRIKTITENALELLSIYQR